MGSLSQIFQAHLKQSGFGVKRRVRVKELSVVGTASAGFVDLFDTDTAPVAGTYTQAGATVTVTDTAHGLSTGDIVGISFDAGTGGEAQPGNYEITVTGANTFTLTQINSTTITGTPACRYVAYTPGPSVTPKRWLMTKETSAGDTYVNVFQLPNEGFLAGHGIYMSISNLSVSDVFFEG